MEYIRGNINPIQEMKFNVNTCWAGTVSTALASLASHGGVAGPFLSTGARRTVTVSTALAVLTCCAVIEFGATFLCARPSRAVAIAALVSLAGHRVTASQIQGEIDVNQ